MSAPGLRVAVRAGRTVPAPLPASLTARLRSVDVTENDEERSVFTLTFDAGRSGGEGRIDVAGLQGSPVTVFSRVLISVTFGIRAALLIDGIVTELTLTPGEGPGAAALAVTGEDVSFLLDREERTAEHPTLDAAGQARAILQPYEVDGIASQVVDPKTDAQPSPHEWVPTQQRSDLDHLVELARCYGFEAYVVPGPVTGTTTSTFYWGPPVRSRPPQPVLSVDLGPETTFSGVTFRTHALEPALFSGDVLDLDSRTGKVIHVDVAGSSRPPLSARPLMQAYSADVRRRLLRGGWCQPVLAGVRAQAETDRSSDAVRAEGAVDGARYGHVLRPRALVDVRGAGWSHDGSWYVKQVGHSLRRGSYQQQVTLTREGHGATTLRLPPGGAG